MQFKIQIALAVLALFAVFAEGVPKVGPPKTHRRDGISMRDDASSQLAKRVPVIFDAASADSDTSESHPLKHPLKDRDVAVEVQARDKVDDAADKVALWLNQNYTIAVLALLCGNVLLAFLSVVIGCCSYRRSKHNYGRL